MTRSSGHGCHYDNHAPSETRRAGEECRTAPTIRLRTEQEGCLERSPSPAPLPRAVEVTSSQREHRRREDPRRPRPRSGRSVSRIERWLVEVALWFVAARGRRKRTLKLLANNSWELVLGFARSDPKAGADFSHVPTHDSRRFDVRVWRGYPWDTGRR